MKAAKRKILMDLDQVRMAIKMARVCMTSESIGNQIGLSEGQVTYRLSTHKKVTGMRETLRQRWKHGRDPLLKQFLSDYAGVMDMEFEREFLGRIVHPTPQTVNK